MPYGFIDGKMRFYRRGDYSWNTPSRFAQSGRETSFKGISNSKRVDQMPRIYRAKQKSEQEKW